MGSSFVLLIALACSVLTENNDRRESEDDSDDDNGGMDYNHGQYRDPIDDEKLERELEARRRALIRYDLQRNSFSF